MTSITLRAGRRDEVAEFIWHVWNIVYKMGAYPSVLRSDGDEHFVAEDRGVVIGFAGITIEPPALETVYVLAAYRGQGIGPRLTEAALRRLVQLGKTSIKCDVTTTGGHHVIERLPADLRQHVWEIETYQCGELHLYEPDV